MGGEGREGDKKEKEGKMKGRKTIRGREKKGRVLYWRGEK